MTIAANLPDDPNWWRSAVVYQVYPRSFADANGDGTGDVAGIIERLPYLAELGVDAIWVSPWYTSPLADGGYDVADYRDILPEFGTLAEADEFVATAHELGMRVLIDLVPNHCSDHHVWFQRALAAAPGSAERDLFIFRDGDGPDGNGPPNNWPAMFGGSAWERTTTADGSPGQWFLHLFAPEQPDWNWENPAVADEFDSILRFWFDRGIDGFRIDVANSMAKEAGLPDLAVDAERSPDGDDAHRHAVHQPAARARHPPPLAHGVGLLRRHRTRCPGVRVRGVGDACRRARQVRPPRRTPHHLQLRRADVRVGRRVAAQRDRPHARRDHRRGGAGHVGVGQPRHDPRRHPLRAPDHRRSFHPDRDGHGLLRRRRQGARRGDRHRARPQAGTRRRAPRTRAARRGLHLPGRRTRPRRGRGHPGRAAPGPDLGTLGPHQQAPGRDGCRVPIPWSGDAAPFGFGSADTPPWLPQPSRWAGLTAAAQDDDPTSHLNHYRVALAERRRHPALGDGTLAWDDDVPADVLSFTREPGFRCVVNFGTEPFPLPDGATVLVRSGLDSDATHVGPDEAVWLQV